MNNINVDFQIRQLDGSLKTVFSKTFNNGASAEAEIEKWMTIPKLNPNKIDMDEKWIEAHLHTASITKNSSELAAEDDQLVNNTYQVERSDDQLVVSKDGMNSVYTQMVLQVLNS